MFGFPLVVVTGIAFMTLEILIVTTEFMLLFVLLFTKFAFHDMKSVLLHVTPNMLGLATIKVFAFHNLLFEGRVLAEQNNVVAMFRLFHCECQSLFFHDKNIIYPNLFIVNYFFLDFLTNLYPSLSAVSRTNLVTVSVVDSFLVHMPCARCSAL